MLNNFDRIIYPITLVAVIVIMIVIFLAAKGKLREKHRRFEKTIAAIIGIYQISLWGVYIAFGQGEALLLTDISPFVFVLTFIPLFTGRLMWLRKALMPYLLLTGIITMALSSPHFSVPFLKDERYITDFIDSMFTYIKHTISLIIGIYFMFTNTKYKGVGWLLPFFIPVVLIGWIFLATGIFYYTTDNPRFGIRSTGIFYPAMLPFVPDTEIVKIADMVKRNTNESYIKANTLNESEYKDIIDYHPGWTSFINQKINYHGETRWFVELPMAKSLWGLKTYIGEPSYAIMFKMHRVLKLHHFAISAIFYALNIIAAYAMAALSNIGKHKER